MKLGRIKYTAWKYARRSQTLLLVLTVLVTLAFLTGVRWSARATSAALLPPPPSGGELAYLRRDRSLKTYLDAIELLVEPSSSLCQGPEPIPLLVLVASSPGHLDSRAAIRRTWGQRMPTYFVLGLTPGRGDDLLVKLYIEAKEYSDLIIYDLEDHYMNLTLKSALILQWSLRRCPQAETLMKTDDDVFINPWTMMKVVKEHVNHHLYGHKFDNRKVHRDLYSKWYLPRWLHPPDTLPEYLAGSGYLINGQYIEKLYKTAHKVPLINLEDVYFTYKVAKEQLGLVLTHDRRVSPFKPLVPAGCALWGLATAHPYSPSQILEAWKRILLLGIEFERGEVPCVFLSFLSNDWLLV